MIDASGADGGGRVAIGRITAANQRIRKKATVRGRLDGQLDSSRASTFPPRMAETAARSSSARGQDNIRRNHLGTRWQDVSVTAICRASSRGKLNFTGSSDTTAPHGETGTLLLRAPASRFWPKTAASATSHG